MTTTATFTARTVKRATLPWLLAACLALAGCAGADSDTAKRAGVGGALGTIGGAAIGAASGSYLTGAAIGAGVGVAGGFIYDQYKKAQDD